MKYKYLINVTAKDIQIGQECLKQGKSSSYHCAIAQALKRKFKGHKVGWAYSGGTVGNLSLESKSPKRCWNFVIAHDDQQPVRPFSFYAVSNKPIRKGVSARS